MKRLEGAIGEFHDAERVLEASVHGARVNQICQGELLDISEPLERARLHQRQLLLGKVDKAVHRVAKAKAVHWAGIILTLLPGAIHIYISE